MRKDIPFGVISSGWRRRSRLLFPSRKKGALSTKTDGRFDTKTAANRPIRISIARYDIDGPHRFTGNVPEQASGNMLIA